MCRPGSMISMPVEAGLLYETQVVIPHSIVLTWSPLYIAIMSTVSLQRMFGKTLNILDVSGTLSHSDHGCTRDHLSRCFQENTISYPLFADADTGIYPHAVSQYHARPKAKRGIAMLSVDKFPYPRKQTRGNEFIPCSDNICDILKRFRSFKIPAITLIWPKSSYKHSITRSYRSGKESGRRSESPLWRHQWRSFVFISHADDVKREIRLHISRLLTNQKRESARSMG